MKNLFKRKLAVLVIFSCSVQVLAQIADPVKGLSFLPESDYRKLPVAEQPVSGSLPPRATLEWSFPDPGYQGRQLSCTAWATTYNKAYRIFDASGREGKPNDYLQSPGFVYSALTGNKCDRGTYISRALGFLTNVGSVSWTDMPYSEDRCDNWRSTSSAAANKSTTTYRLGSNPSAILDEIRNHIAGGDPVIAGILACDDFARPVNGSITQFSGDNPSCGGHAILVVGYDNDLGAVRILNSWGKGNGFWTQDGLAWMKYDVFLKRVREAYVDYGPEINPSGSNFMEQTTFKPDELGLAPTVTAQVLEHALRVSVDPRVLRAFTDEEGPEKVSQWSLWLTLPRGYQLQIKEVTYTLHHPSFKHPVIAKRKSSIFLGTWDGFGCVDDATISATLTDGSIVEAKFNLCELVKSQVPKNLWPSAV